MNPLEYDISVRELAEFVHRRGDLGGETFRRSNRALEGIKGHKRIQQSRGKRLPFGGTGRALVHKRKSGSSRDWSSGRRRRGVTPLVEEIKMVEPGWSTQADPVHWAQLRIYAGILALERA